MTSLTAALRIELLQRDVDSVLFRDVVERFEVSRVTALRWLMRHCLCNPAGSFSAHRLSHDLKSQGQGVARDAVNAMLGPAAKEHLRARQLILVLDRDAAGELLEAPGVEVLPAYEWLLAELAE
jgi:hypothetical protein